MKLLITLLTCFTFLFSHQITAQISNEKVQEHLIGNWEGAFIKNNSYQRIDITFYLQDKNLMSLQVIEEWHPQFGEFVLPVNIDSLGYLNFNTGYGSAKAQLDSISLEISGYIANSNPATYLHFKKVPAAPRRNFEALPVEIQNGEILLKGHLHRPLYAPSKTVVIIVGGRGCYAGPTKYDLYAKLLRKYGVSTLSYHKRGTGNSTGDCNLATIDDFVNDLISIKEFLGAVPYQYENIGVIGSSAGGWVMMKASERTNFDFLISIVGPSTSVREQQLQSLEKGIRHFKLSETAKKEITAYTNLVFDAEPSEKSFDKFQQLLKGAQKNGWNSLLDGTDIPGSAGDISNLWVRRHNYDPTEAFRNCEVPLLAIYGEKDWIVPHQENIERLQQLFDGSRSKYLTTVLLPEAEHGTEVSEGYQELPNEHSYWRFFRISPKVQIEIIRFLKQHNFH